jgi:hypothetical protein
MPDVDPITFTTEVNPLLPELPLYQGLFYAFDASGGFHLAEGIKQVVLAEQASLEVFDLTNCVQVMMDVRLFNQKLGVMKDVSSNTAILNIDGSTNWLFPYTTLNTSYDRKSQVFSDTLGNQVDSVTINALEFSTDISNGGNLSILSVGVLATLYDDFDDYVKQYFGYAGGFASLFESAGTFEIGEGFNEDKLFSLITDSSHNGTWSTNGANEPVFTNVINTTGDGSGFKYNADISGSITIDNIVKSLRFVVDSNVFGNRHPQGIESIVQNPASVYDVTVVDICANEAVDNRFYINDIQQPTIGLTQSSTNSTNIYHYRFRQTVASYATHPFEIVAAVDGTGYASLTGLDVNLSLGGTDVSYQYIDVTFDSNTGMAATAIVGTDSQFYYRCGLHTGMGGILVNHGTFDNPVADSSDPSGNAYIKSFTSTVVDPSYQYNFGVGDGFMANDLIFVRSGIRMKVEVQIAAEAFMPINNIGPLNTTALKTSQQSTFQSFRTDASNNIVLGGIQNPNVPGIEGIFSLEDEVLRTSITRTVQVPLVIRLANLHNGANAFYTDTLPMFQ